MPDPATPVTLERLRELAEAATPGPWRAFDYHPLHESPYVGSDDGVFPGGVFVATTASDAAGIGRADAALIVAAVNALPALLAVVEAAQTALDSGDTFRGRQELRAALALLHPDTVDPESPLEVTRGE